MRAVWKRHEVEAGLVPVQPLYGSEGERRPGALAPPQPSQPMPDEAVARHLRLLNSLAAGLVAERGNQLAALRPELVSLVMLICRELLGREISTNPAVIDYTLGRALEMLRGATRVRARLHPEDVAWLGSISADLPAHVELVPDAALQRGECVLDSDRGSIDATWETQLRLVHEALSWEMPEGEV